MGRDRNSDSTDDNKNSSFKLKHACTWISIKKYSSSSTLSNAPPPSTSAVTNTRIASSRQDRWNMTAPFPGRPFTSHNSDIPIRPIRNDPHAQLNTNEWVRRPPQNNDEQGRHTPDNDPREGLDGRLERDGVIKNSGRLARQTTRDLVKKRVY
ncbi:unnamed protein product [Mytilus coruscus]|uniref:Uncharacterized protein n=1 Tax=Mytilus coruscus TaxID=42192 RepID=A0A6J8C4R4_MYTCO|nr:unnamed protein product [Mytilus coruscus]